MVVETMHRNDDCPPVEALPAAGEVFRCCKHNPPKDVDMMTHEETDRAEDADPCIRRALSVFRTQEDAIHQIRAFKRWPKKRIARATLRPEHGFTLLTPAHERPTHTSWWPASPLNPAARAALFTVVEEVSA